MDVTKVAGVRIQCLFVLCEMDRENVLAKYPTMTRQREKWDNARHVCDEQLEIMKYDLNSLPKVPVEMQDSRGGIKLIY